MAKKIILLLALILLTVTSCEAAENEGISFDTLAVIESNDETQELALVQKKDDGAIYFIMIDKNAEKMALVPYSSALYNFYQNQGEYGDYPPLIFCMLLPEQARGQLDEDLGEWQEDLHAVPVYALFHVEDGQVICEEPFFSAKSLDATHFHLTIKNPMHTQLIEVLMTQMPRLHDEITAKNITLP